MIFILLCFYAAIILVVPVSLSLKLLLKSCILKVFLLLHKSIYPIHVSGFPSHCNRAPSTPYCHCCHHPLYFLAGCVQLLLLVTNGISEDYKYNLVICPCLTENSLLRTEMNSLDLVV